MIRHAMTGGEGIVIKTRWLRAYQRYGRSRTAPCDAYCATALEITIVFCEEMIRQLP
jgi:hypothetical protein